MNSKTLNNYLDKNGTLKLKGKIFLEGKVNKITPTMLTEIVSLGSEGLAKSGGLTGISEQYKVNLRTLNNYLDKNGTLKVRGKFFLGGKKPIK